MKQNSKSIVFLCFFLSCVSFSFYSNVASLPIHNAKIKEVALHSNAMLEQNVALNSQLQTGVADLLNGLFDKFTDDATEKLHASIENSLNDMLYDHVNKIAFLQNRNNSNGIWDSIKKNFNLSSTMNKIRETISKEFKVLFYKYSYQYWPKMENLLAESLQPPTVQDDVYNLLIKNILVSVSNSIEKKLCMNVDDEVYDYPRDPDFKVEEHVSKVSCEAPKNTEDAPTKEVPEN